MEKWKAIPGYEGLYEASVDGRIRSTPGKITSNARYTARHWQSRIMKGRGDNYSTGRRVTLWKDGVPTEYLVARLIAQTWCSGYAPGMTVDHINGNRMDNRAENLEWVPLSENIRRGFQTGLYRRIEKPIALTDTFGNRHEFMSEAEGSRFLRRSHAYIHNALRKGYTISDTDGNVYTVDIGGGACDMT